MQSHLYPLVMSGSLSISDSSEARHPIYRWFRDTHMDYESNWFRFVQIIDRCSEICGFNIWFTNQSNLILTGFVLTLVNYLEYSSSASRLDRLAVQYSRSDRLLNVENIRQKFLSLLHLCLCSRQLCKYIDVRQNGSLSTVRGRQTKESSPVFSFPLSLCF